MKKKKQWSFFQIIHPLIIQNQELGIPRRFVRKFAKDLSDVAVLEVPNGKVWNVSLKRTIDGGEIFFKNGWHDFIKYHSIRNGHFLVFRYHGNSCFYVRIYDTTGCEIDYVSDNNEETNDDDEECQLVRSGVGEKTRECYLGKQKEVISVDADSSSDEPNTLSQQSLSWNGGNKDAKDPTKNTDASDQSNSLRSESRHGIQCSVLEGKEVKEESSVEILYNKPVNNPPGLRRSRRCSVKPITSSSQPVSQGNQRIGTNGCKSKQEEVQMSASETHSEPRPPPPKRAIQAARLFKSENPFCIVNVQQSYVSGTVMYLPYRFMKRYAKMIDYLTLVVPNSGSERAWRCQLLWYNHKYTSHSTMIFAGWKAFVAENNLKVGDACVFELINTEHNLFNVSIFRG